VENVFEVRFLFPTHGDDKVIALLGLIARQLPEVLHAMPGATGFKAPRDVSLTLEIFAEDAADAVAQATAKVARAFELSSQTMPSDFSVEATPAEELEPEDPSSRP